MKKILLKTLLIIVILLVVVVAGALSYVKNLLPDVGSPANIKIEITQKRVERGEYLANHV